MSSLILLVFGMKSRIKLLLSVCIAATLLVLSEGVCATTTRYVAPGGGHQSPYTNWAMAANTLEAALGSAVNGDTVVVSNGVYNVWELITRYIKDCVK